MEKKIIYIVIILSLIWKANIKAQTYYPFPENNSFWTVVEYSIDKSTSYYYVELFEMDGDSVFNNLVYKKVYKLLKDENGIDTLASLHCLIRQDIDQKKVYFIRSYLNETTEKLGYNFNISIGDTL